MFSCFMFIREESGIETFFIFFHFKNERIVVFNVVPISAAQQSDPVIHTRIYSFSHILLHLLPEKCYD